MEHDKVAPLIEAGHDLATAQSHASGCRFHGCTCGVMEVRKKALAEYWRQFRTYKELGGRLEP